MRTPPVIGPVIGTVAAAAQLTVVLMLGGCTGSDEGAEADPEERLAAARQAIDDAASMELELRTPELPPDVDGVVSASGVGNHDPAFDGTIEINASGFAGEAEVVAVDGDVHAQLPFTSEFILVDTEAYGAPDPAALMATEGGISSLLTAATEVEETGERRDGEDVLTELSGTIPGEAMAELFPSADASSSFDATFTLDDEDQLDAATLTGPFYEDNPDVTYNVEIDLSDETVDITAPE